MFSFTTVCATLSRRYVSSHSRTAGASCIRSVSVPKDDTEEATESYKIKHGEHDGERGAGGCG